MDRESILKLVGNDGRFAACQVECSLSPDGIATVWGAADTWRQVVDIGHLVARQPDIVNVVNRLRARGIEIAPQDKSGAIAAARRLGVRAEADIVIIGGGICGCAIARALARYQARIILLEKNSDISEETTKANNGYIHAGHRAAPGTLKAKLNVEGNAMYDQWHEELNFPFLRCGQLNVARTEKDMRALEKNHADGIANKVPGIRLVSAQEAKELEPALEGEIVGALLVPSLAVVEPYSVCIALAENAVSNGVDLWLNCEVLAIDLDSSSRTEAVVTEKGLIKTGWVINCAGIYADEIAAMVDDQFFSLHPRRGGIAIFDKQVKPPYKRSVSVPAPAEQKDEESKGGGFSFTPDGNILAGPSALEVPDKEDKRVEAQDIDYAYSRGAAAYPGLRRQDIIAMYSGVRAADYKEDFIIAMSGKIDGFINVAGIQSPGLAAAPAIARMVEVIVKESRAGQNNPLRLRTDFNPHREKPVEFRHLSLEEQDRLIRRNPAYGRIVCRCEQISEGEILDTIRSPITPTTVDAVKRRVRAGMGRCQGGFCQPKVVEILARELGREWTEINLKGRHAYILARKSREEGL
ncbi:MAG: NAD(P)/FAD-dependent oxidoreductase [Desulfarculales bacterium]|jgi:glycerol-3-phosphate dehydrogenase|nr:NAD(P)/FAD-dependent oxidoreductase [Desulfarculales bacterium]